jgi:hypothetical protein
LGAISLNTGKKLGFSNLRKSVSARVNEIAEIEMRQVGKIKHSMHDACLSTLAMMYFQDASMLEFQRRLQEQTQMNNLQTLFQVETIPKDNQLRGIIDVIPSQKLFPIFNDFFRLLQRGNQLQPFQFLDEGYLLPIDGTQYFSSETINCSSCLTKGYKNGTINYSHKVLGASIVHPEKKQVVPLAPEPIKNSDGSKKQDCEINAGKRFLNRIRKEHPKLEIVITADDLYSRQPFIEALNQNRMSYILIAKPTSHKVLFDQIIEKEDLDQVQLLEWQDNKGAIHRYEWINDIRLNGNKSAPLVNFFEYSTIRDGDKITYTNSWVTDIRVSDDNVVKLVKAGRAKWKIENENFNTLKNLGYHAEHNFGHGKKNLSFNFFLFTLLAFFMHQIIELRDPLYQIARAKFSARKEFWNQLRCTIRIIIFENWESLLHFVISPPTDIRAP